MAEPQKLIRSTSIKADIGSEIAVTFANSDPDFIAKAGDYDLSEFFEFREAFVKYMVSQIDIDTIKSQADIKPIAVSACLIFTKVYNFTVGRGRNEI